MWRVELTGGARKDLQRLGSEAQERVLRYLRERVLATDDPRRLGIALKGTSSGLWRYRVGDYRLICSIEDGRLTVLAVAVGHRREVYD